jgi:hypothetical protein
VERVVDRGELAESVTSLKARHRATTAFDSGVVILGYRPLPNPQASATT